MIDDLKRAGLSHRLRIPLGSRNLSIIVDDDPSIEADIPLCIAL